MIAFECPSCGAKLKSPDDAAGKKAKCKQCGNVSQVPIPLVVKPKEEPRRESPIVEVDYAHKPVPPPIQKNELVPFPPARVPEVLHCIGCNQVVRHEVACRRCGKVFCSEMCLERHEERCGPKKKVRKERDYEPPTIIVNANSSAVASASAKAISGTGQKLLGCAVLFILLFSCCIWFGGMFSKTASTAPDQPKRAVELPADPPDPPKLVVDIPPNKEPEPQKERKTKRARSSRPEATFFGESSQQKAMRDAQAQAAKDEADAKRDKAIADRAAKKKAIEDARPPALTNEEKADSRLKMARQLRETNVTSGNYRLETLIKEYPGTKAAETAQKILDGKEK